MEPTDVAKQDALEAQSKTINDSKIPAVNTYQTNDEIADTEKEIKTIRKQVKQMYKQTVESYKEVVAKYKELSKRKKLIKSVDYALYKETNLDKAKAEFKKLD
jgi:hypothetical protein